jgi:O-antigen ligase
MRTGYERDGKAGLKMERLQENLFKPAQVMNWEATKDAASLLERIIFYTLLVLIALAAVPYGTVEPHWEAAFECVVFALMALWLVEGYLRGTFSFQLSPLLAPLLVLIIFAFLQTIPLWRSQIAGIEIRQAISADFYETRLFAVKVLAITLTLALLIRFTSNHLRLRTLVYLVIGIGVASAIFGLMRQTFQLDAPAFILSYLTPGRGYGQFINRNHFAFLMEMSLGLALGLVAGGAVRRDRMPVYLGAILSLWTTLVLSNSRGGIFSMLAQLIFIALLLPAVRNRKAASERCVPEQRRLLRFSNLFVVRLLLVACLIAVMSLAVVWVGGDSLLTRLESVPVEVSEESADLRIGERRINIWRATLELIKAHPVNGVGFGAFATVIPRYHDAAGGITPQQAHNDYLELLASGGLIGLAIGVWFVTTLILLARQRLRSEDCFRRSACLGALTGIFGVAIHSFLDFGLHPTANALVFVALIVIATKKVDRDKSSSMLHRQGVHRSVSLGPPC